MSNPTVATPVVDKNGKNTTVHKKTGTKVTNDRTKNLGAPVAAAPKTDAEKATEKLQAGINQLNAHKEDVENALAEIVKTREAGYRLDHFKIDALLKTAARESVVYSTANIIDRLQEEGELSDEEILDTVATHLQDRVESFSGANSTSTVSNQMKYAEIEFQLELVKYFRKGSYSFGF